MIAKGVGRFKMTDTELLRIIKEIEEYCDNEKNYSYYDMKAYAYTNKPKWIKALNNRNCRTTIRYYLKSKKKDGGFKYKTPAYVAMDNCSQAAMDYLPIEYQYLVDKERAAEIRTYFKENSQLDLDMLSVSKQSVWEKVLQVAKFVAKSIPHNNQKEPLINLNAISLWEYAQRVPSGFNCRWHSILLSELLLSIGIKNRFVTCMPEDKNDHDCHVVNLVWLPENEKWAMIDSDMMEYVTDENGVPLSLEEMQRELNAGRELSIIMDTDTEGLKNMQSYWKKNLHHFANHTTCAFDIEGQYGTFTSYICLVPENYDCPHKEIYDAITTNAAAFWDR